MTNTSDYSTRQGFMATLITSSDLMINIPVYHTKINSFRWIIELLVHYSSHRKWATATNRVRYTAVYLTLLCTEQEKRNYKDAREDVKEEVWEALAINISNATNMVRGTAFHSFNIRKFSMDLVFICESVFF